MKGKGDSTRVGEISMVDEDKMRAPEIHKLSTSARVTHCDHHHFLDRDSAVPDTNEL